MKKIFALILISSIMLAGCVKESTTAVNNLNLSQETKIGDRATVESFLDIEHKKIIYVARYQTTGAGIATAVSDTTEVVKDSTSSLRYEGETKTTHFKTTTFIDDKFKKIIYITTHFTGDGIGISVTDLK